MSCQYLPIATFAAVTEEIPGLSAPGTASLDIRSKALQHPNADKTGRGAR